MKLGIIVDSASGMTKAEANKKNWGYLPLYMTINDKEYADGVDITPAQYYKMISLDMNVKTSATPPGVVIEELEKFTKKYDEVIVYTISKKLSSQCSNITALAKDYKNVHVIQSEAVGEGIKMQLESLEKMADKESISAIVKKGNELTKSMVGIAVPETLDWLAKGGRASSGTVSMANLLKIVPMIQFKNGELEKYGKGRVFRKTLLKAATAVVEMTGKEHDTWLIMSAGNPQAKEFAKDIEEQIQKKIKIVDFPPVIGNHIGKGAMAIMALKK